MFDLNDNLFGYINKSSDITTSIIQQYKNSLIFIGDEQQMYIPATNSYVGVGLSTLNNLKQQVINSVSSSDKIYISDVANYNQDRTYFIPTINNNMPNSYYYTYVAHNVGINPYKGKFVGGLEGTADYATVSNVTYTNVIKHTNETSSYYVSFVNSLNDTSYEYVNNKLLYTPGLETLTCTNFQGNLYGHATSATYATYSTYSTYTTYTTYSIFNSYQSLHRIDNSNKMYYVTFGDNNNTTYSLSYIDQQFYYNPYLNCVYFGTAYGNVYGSATKLSFPVNVTLYSSTYYPSSYTTTFDGSQDLNIQIPEEFENTIKTIEEVTAYALNDLNDKCSYNSNYSYNLYKNLYNNAFTTFENAGTQQTRITIGGVTKDLNIDADKLDGFDANTLLQSFDGGKLSSNGNILTQSNHTIKIGNTEKSAGESNNVKIINSADWSYVGSLPYTNTTYNLVLRYKVNDFESTYTYIPKIYAYSASYIDDIGAKELFTQFENTSNQNTRITIGGTTKDLQIESYKTLVSQKTDDATYPLVFTNATNLSGSSYLYKNYSNLLYNPYKQSLSSGLNTKAIGIHSFATGSDTKAEGENSFVEGQNTQATQRNAHAEGQSTNAINVNSHAEGYNTTASGICAHAEGGNNTASGNNAHAEGSNTTASGENSHTSGLYTLASHINESAFGKYNASNNDTLFSVGIGTASNNRINAFEVTTDGKVKAYDGFYKNNSDNTYLLLGGGGHKLLTDLFTQFADAGGQTTRITIGGETKDLKIDADTLDGYHADGLFTAFDNSGNDITATIGGTTKTFTVNYAINSTSVEYLNNYTVSDPNTAKKDNKVKWFAQINQSSGYAGNNYGFPVSNNANGILYLGTHPGEYGHQLGFSSNGSIYRRYQNGSTFPTTANGGSWLRILDSGNSSVSGGGSSWGSSITVTINDVTKTLTIPSNPNTDYRVTQNSDSTNAEYRLLFKYSANDTNETTTVKYNTSLRYNPSTGNLFNNGNFYIDTADNDRFIQFRYNANNYAGASWRLISRGSGSGDTNYFDIETGGSDQNANIWYSVIRLTMDNRRVGIGTDSPSDKLDVGGYIRSSANSRYLQIGPQNASWAHYNTNADTGHYFNKAVHVDGDIYLYGTSVRMQKSDGYVYASGFYHNSVGSNNYVLTAGGSYKQWTTSNTANAIIARDSNGDFSARYFVSNINDEDISIGSVFVRNTSDNYVRRVSFSTFLSKLYSDETVSFTKSLKVTEAWMDTDITTESSNFPKGNGTYAIQISHGTLSNGTDSWPAIYSGIMTIYTGTNSTTHSEEVILHRSGHEGGKRLYLRVMPTASSTGYCKIQIAAESNFENAGDITFKFRKLI